MHFINSHSCTFDEKDARTLAVAVEGGPDASAASASAKVEAKASNFVDPAFRGLKP